jgi:prepilin-type N-terminal cleavage/methylation domain-containing protein
MSNPFRAYPSFTARRRRAFTLVELMISIALALMLIYGISQVFKMSGDTVGAQQAVSANVRDQRAASATMTEDWRNSMPDSPLVLISNRVAYGYDGTAKSGFHAGFKNAEEERNGDVTGDPTRQDVNGTPFIVKVAQGTDRTPRLDRLGFFARNIFRSQMPDNTTVASGLAGGEAYIWYGHVAIVNPSTGKPIQPQDQYGSDRVLGRVAVLMKDTGMPPLNPLAAKFLPPLANNVNVWRSVQDFAPANVEQWRQTANLAYNNGNNLTPGAAAFAWYAPLLDPNTAAITYWRPLCQPTLLRPVTQEKLSQTVPYFVGNCTQFIVEYAGDFVDQDETDPLVPGRVIDVKRKRKLASATGTVPEEIETDTPQHRAIDGDQIDYIIDTSGDPASPPNDPSKWVKKVRWYGLPRDINGDGAVTIDDVVPLADVLAYYDSLDPAKYPPTIAANPVTIKTSDNKLPWAPWEVEVPNPGLLGTGNDYRNFPSAQANAFRYTCAFHNDAPAMIRITMKVDDPTGRIKDGQWFQYILSR